MLDEEYVDSNEKPLFSVECAPKDSIKSMLKFFVEANEFFKATKYKNAIAAIPEVHKSSSSD